MAVHMATTAVIVKIGEEGIAPELRDAAAKLGKVEGETVLDFSSVRRIDPAALRALEDLARAADEKAVKVVIRGANVDVYKVLKLVKLTRWFSFLN
jgi:anti-anti-sigma regulatory factor